MRGGFCKQITALSLAILLGGCGVATEGTQVPEIQQDSEKSVNLENDTNEDDVASDQSDEISAENDSMSEEEGASEEADESPIGEELDDEQKNSIAMLNYLAVLSQEINSSKNSRMFLEEAYASLINNTNPEEVNMITESHLASLLDVIERYRMIAVKRDRLQYIYEQNKAGAIRKAVPNPIGLLSAVESADVKRLAASILFMAVDSVASYKDYNSELNFQYLQDGWELDDEEAENIHENRKQAFMFMIDIVREDNLPGELALNEKSVEEYVSWKNNTNVDQKIQFFESQEQAYEAFGDYWLTLATCYYEKEEYKKCLECFDKYEQLQANIFRKDYNLAKSLPMAVIAAKEVYSQEDYISAADRYLKMIIDNTENSEWSLKYFVAQMDLDLYRQTNDDSYLEKAYSLALNNVNHLVAEQRKLNEEYLDEVKELKLPDDPTKEASDGEKVSIKEEKKRIKEYNKALAAKRKVELPSIYEPLELNCELLFALADKRGLSDSEKSRIEGILHQDGNNLFLDELIDNQYSFSPEEYDIQGRFENGSLVLPVECLSENSFVRTDISDGGEDEAVYEDWQVKKVDRMSDDIESFKATYISKECSNHKWSPDSKVKVEIYDEEETDKEPFVIEFKVSKFKKMPIPLFHDKVEFEQVK